MVFDISCVGLGYVFVFKYASEVHHCGLFFIAIVIQRRQKHKYAFSESVDMARFIQGSQLEQARITADPPMSSVLALLPLRPFWFPALGAEASYMKWDARYRNGGHTPAGTAVGLMKARWPD